MDRELDHAVPVDVQARQREPVLHSKVEAVASRIDQVSSGMKEVCLRIWLARACCAEARSCCNELVPTSGGDVISVCVSFCLGVSLVPFS